ncbi:MAG: DoxX family protein [Pseudonocardia sp.]|nr:DoxX family protein [Pseudonocardia sp.]
MTTTTIAPALPRRRALTVTLWTLQVLIAVFFLVAAAGPKLLGDPIAVQLFSELGGQWFRYVIGVIELTGAIGLLVPRLAGPAALGLVGLMIGAVITQVFWFGSPVSTIAPAVLGVMVAFVAWQRRSEIRPGLTRTPRRA